VRKIIYVINYRQSPTRGDSLAKKVSGDGLQASATLHGIVENRLVNFEVVTTNQDGAVMLKGYAQARVD
jgi:hypothetical protein